MLTHNAIATVSNQHDNPRWVLKVTFSFATRTAVRVPAVLLPPVAPAEGRQGHGTAEHLT